MTYIHSTPKPNVNQITMVVRGRRALGETWSKVTISENHTTDKIDVIREDTEAPADDRPIMILGAKEQEYADYILTAALEKATARGKTVAELVTDRAEYAKTLNEIWHDYMLEKVRLYRGISQIGATGHLTQRQRVERDPNA